MDKLTPTQQLIATLIQLAGVSAGLIGGLRTKHPVAGTLLGSFAGSALAAVYIYVSTPPSERAIAANGDGGALPRAAT